LRPALVTEVTAIGLDFVIMGALATILLIGLQLMRMSARYDRGQPWALHRADHEDQTGVRQFDVRSEGQEPPLADAPLEAEAVVREAEQIVAAGGRANR
jgi:hypothetical protein